MLRDIDPLLKDLSEKKQNFRKNVVSLAEELKDVRIRLASSEQSFAREIVLKQEAEIKAKQMEEKKTELLNCLEAKNGQLKASDCMSEKLVKELDDLRSQLSATTISADASAALAHSAQLQCSTLLIDWDQKNNSIREQEIHVNRISEQLDLLQKDLCLRESMQIKLKDNVLDEVSPNSYEKINKLLIFKEEEMTKLRDEIRIMSAHWKLKIKDLESQLEKHRRTDRELKKKVLKLEFCLQEARSQTRKLQRMGERRDTLIKELQNQFTNKQNFGNEKNNNNIWETSGFKIVVSMSMLVLVLFSKR
ncbi:nuclear envelope-associated protein 2-like [Impatiens glandulifera]|uniref:nuclear envelope-associated protein 2-like n=1 Tax=Impatiens glandulifera TaxID=253017 RepID=UPI001FB162CA|nr:nuclear envelope-associated protein 2-like [Impatiens glandulifera]